MVRRKLVGDKTPTMMLMMTPMVKMVVVTIITEHAYAKTDLEIYQ